MNKIYTDKQVINIIDDNKDLTMSLNDGQMVIINCFFKQIMDMNINISQSDNSYLVINYAGYVQRDAIVNVDVKVTGNSNKTVINVRTIEENGHADFNVSVKANEHTINNEITEDLKAINEEGTITFMPILQIDTNEVQAEHFATIGGLDEKELFYLESKMLSTDTAKNLLKKSFIYNLFSDNFKMMLGEGEEKDE